MQTNIILKENGHGLIFLNNEKIFIHKLKTKNSLPGDLVEIEFYQYRNKTEAKVKKILNREKTKYVGIIKKIKNKVYVEPINSFGTPFLIDLMQSNIHYDKIKNNDKVVVEFLSWKKDGDLRGKIVEVLGESLTNETEMHSIIIEYGFETKFPDKVIEESEKISDIVEVGKDRIDMRNINTFTIDPESAKDFDDALSIDEHTNGYTVGVHIADVSHYVKVNSEIDKEAIKRATSVYLVDRTIPMLPERLSNGLCSLNPNVDRYAFSVMFDLDKKGKINKYWLQNSVINSNRRYSYEEALDIIEGKEDKYSKELKQLYELSLFLKKNRSNDNLEIKRKEPKFKIDENGSPLEIYFKEPTKSTELIEEFMLLANKHVGLEFQKKGYKFIWRNHDLPNLEKITDFEIYMNMIGHNHKIRPKHIKEDLNDALVKVKDTSFHETCSMLVMKSMSKAEYSSNNIGHYGLGFSTYSHFTSPIRRYPDLIAHRILKKHLEGKVYNYPNLEERCSRCNQREVMAQKAERDSIKYKQAEYMSKYIDTEFEGTVSFILSNKVFIILENGIESICPIIEHYDNDDYEFYHAGRMIKIGDKVKVKIKKCDLFRKEIESKIV